MPTYFFFPFLEDGGCLTFTTGVLDDDGKALVEAQRVLADHPSAREVLVWLGERKVGLCKRPAGAGTRKLRTVLVVEDCPFQAEALAYAFGQLGYQVWCCAEEIQALEALDHADIDLAVVDIDLGEGPIYGVAEALKLARVPFMFVTGYDRSALPDDWARAGYISKPATGRAVAQAADDLLTPAMDPA